RYAIDHIFELLATFVLVLFGERDLFMCLVCRFQVVLPYKWLIEVIGAAFLSIAYLRVVLARTACDRVVRVANCYEAPVSGASVRTRRTICGNEDKKGL